VRDRDGVHLEHRVHRLDLLLLEQPAGHQAGVVDEHVDSPQLLTELLAAALERLP
jgi:hypothetical protein